MSKSSRVELAKKVIDLKGRSGAFDVTHKPALYIPAIIWTFALLFLFLMLFLWWFGQGIGVRSLFSSNLRDQFTILVAGTDMAYHGQRTDTMFIGFVFPETRKLELFSLPRDTFVDIPGRSSKKLNSAYASGGVELLKKTVENNLGIKLDHYVVVNIDGFVHIIDILGGIDLEVEQDMDYDDIRGNLHIHLKKGHQHLDGEKAMQYVRFREKLFADIGRIQRQQKFLEAISGKFKEVDILWKLPALIREVRNNVKTDLSYEDILKTVNQYSDFDKRNLRMRILPGTADYIEKISYYLPDIEAFHRQVEEILADGKEDDGLPEKAVLDEFIRTLQAPADTGGITNSTTGTEPVLILPVKSTSECGSGLSSGKDTPDVPDMEGSRESQVTPGTSETQTR
ncbi:MAG: LCP family protein [Candidatus Wallbacteria bacterium]|nr:LCP family protein [Candidatus Wallbacteria bacterium]